MNSSTRAVLVDSSDRRDCAVLAITGGQAAGCGHSIDARPDANRVEARRLASNLRVQFSKAADASNRAVMAVTDEASSAAAREAEQATQAVERDAEALDSGSSRHSRIAMTSRQLDAFKACFVGYRALDADILPLAVENTNIKAQRLVLRSRARRRQRLPAIPRGRRAIDRGEEHCCVEALDRKRRRQPCSRCRSSRRGTSLNPTRPRCREWRRRWPRLKQPPGAGARYLEGTASARRWNRSSPQPLPPSTGSRRPMPRLVTLSRRNSNVRSLALVAGPEAHGDRRMRRLLLHALEEALAKHDFTATR